jgi:CubicO group peptidase (beta-lactamase class C family)
MISEFLQKRIEARDFPSAVYLIAEKGDIVAHDALGHAVVEPENIAAVNDTIYDLASVTKVLITAILAAKLIEEGRMDLDAKVGDILTTRRQLGKLGMITVRQLVTHTSGLPGWLPFYLLVAERDDILDEIARTPLGEPNVVYSDPNFWVLTFIVEHLFGEPITETARRFIFEPLGLKDTSYKPREEDRHRVAASEHGTMFERQLCRDLGYDFTKNRVTGKPGFRDELIWGEVHDQNAWTFGNVCGHAGLFSTAKEVFNIAEQFLPGRTTLFRPETCGLFTRNLTEGMNEDRSLCFELASTQDSTAGTRLSPQSFGHLGFTGTSLWIDPVKERIFILLTNRTHARKPPFANINPVRRRFHELAAELLNSEN